MKKVLALLLCLLSSFGLVACKGEGGNSLVSLGKDETLVVGEKKFVNVTDTTTQQSMLAYISRKKYVLCRSASALGLTRFVRYSDGFYYWDVEKEYDERVIGKETIVSTITYSYLPFGQDNENILVKKTVEMAKSFDYKGGEIEIKPEVKFVLNGYFSSIDTLRESCVELYNLLGDYKTENYYIDVTVPDETTVSYEQFTDTYYYFE